jgi:hypothetical protein
MVNDHSRNNYACLFSIVIRGRAPPPAAHHIVSGIASKTEPAKFLVIFIANDKDEVVTIDK